VQNIFALILIIVAIWGVFGFVSPRYEKVKTLKASIEEYDEALQLARQAEALRANLIQKYTSFSRTDLEKLQKLLPDSVDNVRLIIDLNGIAARAGMYISDVKVESGGQTSLARESAPTTVKTSAGGAAVEDVALRFSVTGPYESFKNFLFDVERSLRIVDITATAIRPGKLQNTYDLRLRTYWLKK